MIWRDHIETNPDVLSGKPVVKDTRIAVEFVVDLLAQGWTTDDLLDQYPALTREDVRACLHYASEILKSERIHPLTPDTEA